MKHRLTKINRKFADLIRTKLNPRTCLLVKRCANKNIQTWFWILINYTCSGPLLLLLIENFSQTFQRFILVCRLRYNLWINKSPAQDDHNMGELNDGSEYHWHQIIFKALSLFLFLSITHSHFILSLFFPIFCLAFSFWFFLQSSFLFFLSLLISLLTSPLT